MNIKITVKVPDLTLFAGQVFVDRVARQQREKTAPRLKELFEKTTKGWEHDVRFVQHQEIRSYSISMTVSTTNWRYVLVNSGSPSHPIFPRRRKMLRFQRGYTAATRPRILDSRAKVRSGGYEDYESIPNHPGFKPREFDQVIAETHEPEFERDMQEAFDLTKHI